MGTYAIEIDQQVVIKKFEFTCSPKFSQIIVWELYMVIFILDYFRDSLKFHPIRWQSNKIKKFKTITSKLKLDFGVVSNFLRQHYPPQNKDTNAI